MDAQVNCIAHLLIGWLRPQIRCFYALQNDNISLKSQRKHLVWCSLDASNENTQHCKFGNFHENFIFANSVKKTHLRLKKSQTGHYLLISVNDRVIYPIHEGLKIKLTRKILNLQCNMGHVARKSDFVLYEQPRSRPACMSTQSDQRL